MKTGVGTPSQADVVQEQQMSIAKKQIRISVSMYDSRCNYGNKIEDELGEVVTVALTTVKVLEGTCKPLF